MHIAGFPNMIMYYSSHANREDEVYYYHGDLCGSRAQSQACLRYAEMQQSVRSKHLGSASWITNNYGSAVQHLQYLPYGEPFVNQRTSGYNERFTFTGKERDEETGYGYFGARYMDHELMTMWLSVDPMANKYPSLSPYSYCAWNPLKLVDPDGKDIWEIDDEGRVVKHIKDKTKDAFYRVNSNGERMTGEENFVEFKYRTIEAHIKRSYSHKNQIGIYDAFQVRGDDNGERLFMFFAKAVADKEMEVSHIKCGIKGRRGLNYVSTAHFKPVIETKENGFVYLVASEPSQACLWNGQLKNGYTIREINHSHPLSPDPSESDLIMANQIRQIYQNRGNASVPSLNIYYIKEERYIPY